MTSEQKIAAYRTLGIMIGIFVVVSFSIFMLTVSPDLFLGILSFILAFCFFGVAIHSIYTVQLHNLERKKREEEYKNRPPSKAKRFPIFWPRFASMLMAP